MLEGPPDPYKQPDKLILPAPPEQQYRSSHAEYLAHTEQRPLPAGRLVHKSGHASLQAGSLYKRLVSLWQKDPAYKVLFIAIGVVLVSSIACIALLTQLANQLVPPPQLADSPSRLQVTPTPAVPPTPQPTPTPAVTPTPMPTPTPIAIATPEPVATAPVIIQPTPDSNARLTVRINALPEQVSNNTTIPITVSTNKSGAIVSLFITYSAIPPFSGTDAQPTDAGGNTTFNWTAHVRTFSPLTRMVAAHITAVARYQDFQQASSQPVTIYILTK